MSRDFGYAAELQREIPGCTITQDRDGRWHYRLPCGACPVTLPGGLVEAFTNAAKLPIEKIRLRLADTGWKLGNRANKHRCPEHATAPRAPKQEPTVMPVAEPTTAAAPSDKARVARREAVLLLGDVFDVAAGRFRGDDSDKTVADATGLAVDAVVKLREEFYGPLKVPTEVEQLAADLDALRANIGREFEALRVSLASMEEDALERVKAMENRVSAVAGKFL